MKVMMICLGNICRSPMAEFVLKDMVKQRGLADEFVIASSATSREEIGNPVHPGTQRKLAQVTSLPEAEATSLIEGGDSGE